MTVDVRLRAAVAAAALLTTSACTGTPPSGPPSAAAPTTVTVTSAPGAVVAALLARPVARPSALPNGACPTSPRMTHSAVAQPADAEGLGQAPLYPMTFYIGDGTLTLPTGTDNPPSGERHPGYAEMKVVWASSDGYTGPVVVRVVSVGGSGKGFVEIYDNPQLTHGDAVEFDLGPYAQDWPSGTFVTGRGCWAYQIEGADFSELVYFHVV